MLPLIPLTFHLEQQDPLRLPQHAGSMLRGAFGSALRKVACMTGKKDCKTCPLKSQCTKLPKRIIQRSEYQDAVDTNNNNIKQNPQYYKRRQAICEHPFGTIKRHWGFTHTLLKGLQKVNGEMNLIMFCYNFLRTKSILGFDKMLQAIQNWQPDYSKVVCSLKTALIKSLFSQNKTTDFFQLYPLSFLKTA